MPSEKFHNSETAVEGQPNDRIEIGWSREQEYDGVYVTSVVELEDGPPIVNAIPLDRSGLNRMIRTLRKARDQVYGRDE